MSSSGTLRDIEIQRRDLDLLVGLFESRVMTTAHAAALYFDGSGEAAKKRLQRLKAVGLVGERPRRAIEPAILFLGKRGFEELKRRGELSRYPHLSWPQLEKRARVSELTLRHELAVLDVKAAVCAAVAREPLRCVAEFSTWPALSEFMACPAPGQRPVLLKPDGFIRIDETEADGSLSESAYFLELDRSTETQERVALKAACYLDFYKRGGFAERVGLRRDQFKEAPYIVLIVFRNQERRNNCAERLLCGVVPVLTQTWLTTMSELLENPLGPIWLLPRDYRHAVHDTVFDLPQSKRKDTYVRRVEREAFIETNVPKHSLFTDSSVSSAL